MTTPMQTDKIQCKVCKEQIQAGASKCTECGSYQDWTRYLLRWSTLVVAILGLAPLWGIANSLKTIALSSKTADISAVLTSCASDYFNLTLANSGNLAGIVTETNFRLKLNGKSHQPSYQVRASDDISDIVISPNQPPVQFKYQAYNRKMPTNFTSESIGYSSCQYALTIKWIDLKQNSNQLSLECECPQQ